MARKKKTEEEKALKKKETYKTNFIKNSLRRASYRWPARNEALKSARVERGLYRCAMCQLTFKRDQVQIDHIIPVIDIKEGHTTWDKYIERLFCDQNGFQICCITCHDIKTSQEDKLRAVYNAERKINVK